MKRRFRGLDRAIVKRGLVLADFPFQVSFSDFREDVFNIVQKDDIIDISGMTMILKFLRHFGGEVKFLSCNFYGASEEQVFTVFTYITKYCTNLKKLYFGFLRHGLSYSLRNSFEQVTELLFSNCQLDKELCKLDMYFPHVKEISFYDSNEFQSLNKIIVKYPNLEKKSIDYDSMDIFSVALLQAINSTAKIVYVGHEVDVLVLGFDDE